MSNRIEAVRRAAQEFYKKHGKWPLAIRVHPIFKTHLMHEAELWSWGNIGNGLGLEFEGMKVEVTSDVHAFEVRALPNAGDGQ
jgi:ribosomal protein L16/L10AE